VAGDCGDSCFRCFELIERTEVDTSQRLDQARGFRPFQRESCVCVRAIIESYVVHDDVFVEAGDQTFTYHREGNAEELAGLRVRFDLGLNVSLGIQKQRNSAAVKLEALDVVGEDGVQVAEAVGAGELKISPVVFVEQGDGFTGHTIFGFPVAKVIWQGAAKPQAHLCAFAPVRFGEDCRQNCLRRFHLFVTP
jgi:hypothetical protein